MVPPTIILSRDPIYSYEIHRTHHYISMENSVTLEESVYKKYKKENLNQSIHPLNLRSQSPCTLNWFSIKALYFGSESLTLDHSVHTNCLRSEYSCTLPKCKAILI